MSAPKKGKAPEKPPQPELNTVVDKKTNMGRRKGFRMPYISQQLATNQEAETEKKNQVGKVVNFLFTKPGERSNEMAKLRHQSTIETFVSSDLGVEPERAHGSSKRIYDDIFNNLAESSRRTAAVAAPLSEAQEHKIEHKVELDFLHHADDLTHMVLELPHGFHPKPTEDSHVVDKESNLNTALLGLPGGLSLTPNITKHYFGEKSRNDFFERFHWLSYQRQLVGTTSPRRQGAGQADDETTVDGSVTTMSHAGGAANDLAEDLILDCTDPLEEYIPFAARRPADRNEDDVHVMPMSRIRNKSRSLYLTMSTESPPSLDEVLKSEGSVLKALAADKAANEAAAAAKAAAEELAKKRATPYSSKERLEARKRGIHLNSRGRVAVPERYRPESAGAVETARAAAEETQKSFARSVLKRPLSAKTVTAMATLRNPTQLKAIKEDGELRLISMRSEIDVSEDPHKLEMLADEARRKLREEQEKIKLDKMRARLRATIETWQQRATHGEDDKEAKPEKLTMVKDKEDLNIKTEHVDIKPVKYVSGTRGQRLASIAVKQPGGKQDGVTAQNTAANATAGTNNTTSNTSARTGSMSPPKPKEGAQPSSPQKGALVGALPHLPAETPGIAPNSFASKAASSRRGAPHQRSGKLSSPSRDEMVGRNPFKLDSVSMDSMGSGGRGNSGINVSASSPDLFGLQNASIVTSQTQINGMLIGPGGVLDESKYGNSTVMFDDTSVQSSPRRMMDDRSLGNRTNLSLGLETVAMENELRVLAEESDVTFAPPSPRTTYIAGCMDAGLNPKPSLVLRKSFTKRLELQHQGMGDAMAVVLSESLKTLPFIQSINLMDNKLTDDGLGPLLKASLGIPGLLELNLSQNEIGSVAADALHQYLCWEKCPLQKLVLANADVDDGECASFIEAVKQNRSLRELDLSNNKIGDQENYNTVFPDFTTGGEAIADLLCDEDCHLEVLRLDWNKIRLDSGIKIADSLASNQHLLYLDLSYNTLGHDGGITLGRSLEKNKSLKTIVVTNNGLDAAACITICAGVIENTCIKSVFIDGNPIGTQGSKALMLVPMVVGSRVKVSATKCNISLKDPKCPYDFQNLLQQYDLSMEDPFERAVLMILLHMIASHHTYHFSQFEHHLPTRGGKGGKGGSNSAGGSRGRNNQASVGRVRLFNVVQSFNDDKVKHFDEGQMRMWENLKRIQAAASDFTQAITLFSEIDKDGSGELDKDELSMLMKSIGVEMSQKRIDEVMYTYDVDGGGTIGIPEFLAFLKSQYYEAESRIKDLVEMPIIALNNTPKIRYVPPATGRMVFKITDGFTRKKILRVMSACDKEYISEASSGAGVNSIQMVSHGLQSSMMRLDEGLAMFDTMMNETRHKINVLVKLLPQMADPMDAKQLVAAALNYNKAEVLQLKRQMRYALKPILGDPNGYYILDMSDDMDRLCVTRLLEISKTTARNKSEKSKIGFGLVGDLSQHGNWSCFRNEMFNGSHFILTLAFANPLPKKGILEFDFSAGSRPPKGGMCISDNRIVQVLINHFMLPNDRRQRAMELLTRQLVMGEMSLDCDGHTAYAPDLKRAHAISLYQDKFLDMLPKRAMMVEMQGEDEKLGRLKEGELPQRLTLPDILLDDHHHHHHHHHHKHKNDKKKEDEDEGTIKMLGYDDEDFDESSASYSSASSSEMESEHDEGDLDGDGDGDGLGDGEAVDGGSAASDDDNDDDDKNAPVGSKVNFGDMNGDDAGQSGKGMKKKAGILDINVEMLEVLETNQDSDKVIESGADFMQKFQRLLDARNVSTSMKARRIIDVLSDVLARSYLLSRHIALIIDCFRPFGERKSSEYFGTYNVELIIAFFDKIIDMHNFDLVLCRLTAFEVACLYCRLGVLSIYNPAKPEGAWELNMSRWDERLVAKTLCFLATVEPGENWIGEEFRHSRLMDPMPGWELVQLWLTDEGMPRKGILSLEYYSGECQFKNGCRPNINARKSLFNLVLIEESELVEEGLRDREQVLHGDKAIKAHLPYWTGYLAVPKETDEKIATDFEKLLKFNEFAVEQQKAEKAAQKAQAGGGAAPSGDAKKSGKAGKSAKQSAKSGKA